MVPNKKPCGRQSATGNGQSKESLISDFLMMAEAVQKLHGDVVYECPSQGLSWRYLDAGWKSLGMKEIEISSGKSEAKAHLLITKGHQLGLRGRWLLIATRS